MVLLGSRILRSINTNKIATEARLSPQTVCSDKALEQMARLLPTTIEGFASIPGITKLQVETFYTNFYPTLVDLKKPTARAARATKGATKVPSAKVPRFTTADGPSSRSTSTRRATASTPSTSGANKTSKRQAASKNVTNSTSSFVRMMPI
jgi:hypothetical protein